MKDEKFCFKKSTGFIALVGILLVGFVLFAQMSNTSTTSTNTRAASCVENVTKCADGTFAGQCSKMSNGDFNGYKCGCFGKAYAELKKKADGTDATGCEKPVANTVYCQFNNEIVTDTSSKYKWVDSTATVANAGTGLAVGDPIKCIVDVVKNENVGARCFTNASGDINKRYSLWNAETKANCPVPAGSCTGTCTGKAQGTCDSGKICSCLAGKTYPTWNLDASCAVTPAGPTCEFGGELVTDTSSKYKWVDSTATVANAGTGLAVGDPIKCIVDVVKNENVGARCFTNASGDINKRYSLWNAETKANCPVPAGSCTGKCTGANGSTWDQGKCDPAGTGKVCACQAGKTYPTWNLDRGVCPLPIVEPTTAL